MKKIMSNEICQQGKVVSGKALDQHNSINKHGDVKTPASNPHNTFMSETLIVHRDCQLVVVYHTAASKSLCISHKHFDFCDISFALKNGSSE